MEKNISIAIVLMGVSLFIMLPTPDEIVVYPAFGLIFSNLFNMPFIQGAFLAIIGYNTVGVLCMTGSFLLGGKQMLEKLRVGIRVYMYPQKIEKEKIQTRPVPMKSEPVSTLIPFGPVNDEL
jgi:hypothetical protein